MEVFIVNRLSWNGDYTVRYVDSVWADRKAAETFVKNNNAKRTSTYETEYEIEDDAFTVCA